MAKLKKCPITAAVINWRWLSLLGLWKKSNRPVSDGL